MMIVRGMVRPFLHWQRESEYTMICIASASASSNVAAIVHSSDFELSFGSSAFLILALFDLPLPSGTASNRGE